jgi:hypothetical protein
MAAGNCPGNLFLRAKGHETHWCQGLGRSLEERDGIEVVNNRPTNIWLYAKCRKYVDPDAPDAEQEAEASKFGAEVNVTGEYDGNPTGR